jgi:hypothetical protein
VGRPILHSSWQLLLPLCLTAAGAWHVQGRCRYMLSNLQAAGCTVGVFAGAREVV